jgi:AcrR family transcriptional regulator
MRPFDDEGGGLPLSSPGNRITAAAIKIFRDRGIQEARMEDIAQEACLSRPNLYRYVKSRDDVVKLVVLHRARYILQELTVPDGPWHEALIEVFVKQVDLALRDEIFLLVVEQAGAVAAKLLADDDAVQTSLNQVISPILAKGRAAGEIRDGLSDEEILYWLHYQTWCLTRDPRLRDAMQVHHLARKFVIGGLLKPGIVLSGGGGPPTAKKKARPSRRSKRS